MEDINSYALDLELNLVDNVQPIFEGLGDRLSAFQSQIDDVGTKISGTITTSAGHFSDQFAKLVKSGEALRDWVFKTNEDLTETVEDSVDINKHHDDLQKILGTITDNREDALDNLTLQNTLTKIGMNNTTLWGKAWHNVAGFIAEGVEEFSVWTAAAVAGGVVLAGLARGWQMLATEEERFVTINYRAYGTQRSLVQQVSETTMQYGLLREQALAAYEVLAGSLRIPQEQLDQYVKTTVEFNRVTGVSIGQVGDWIRRMRLSGYELIDIRRDLQGYESAMRIAGATTAEMQQLMQKQSELMTLNVIRFGKASAQAMREQDMAIGALARAHGADLDIMTRLNQSLANNLVAQSLARDLGASYLAQLGDRAKAFENLGDAQTQELGKLRMMSEAADVFNNTLDPRAQMVRFEALGRLWGMSGIEVRQLGEQWKLTVDEMRANGFTGDEADLAIQALKKYQEEQAKTANYQEAMNTLFAQFNAIAGYMGSLWVQVAVAIAPFFMRFLSGLELVIHATGTMIEYVLGLGKAVAILWSPFVLLYDAVVSLAKGFIDGLNAAFKPFLGFIDMLYQAIFDQGPIWQNLSKSLRDVGYVLGMVLAPVMAVVLASATALGVTLLSYFVPAIAAAASGLITGLIPAFVGLVPAIITATGAMWTFLAPFLPFAAAGIAIIGVLAAIGAYLYKTGAAMEFVNSMWAAAKAGLDPVWTALGELKKAFVPVIEAFQPLIDVVKQLFSLGDEADKYGVIVPIFGAIGKAIGTMLTVGLWPLTWGIKVLTSYVNVVVAVFRSLFGEATETTGVLAALAGVINACTYPFDLLWWAMKRVIDVFGASGAGIIEEAGWASVALEALSFPIRLVTGLIDTMGGVIGTVISSFGGLVDIIGGAVSAVFGSIGGIITSVGSVVANAVVAMGQAVSAPFLAIGEASTAVGTAVSGVLDHLAGFITNTPGVGSALAAIADGINLVLTPMKAMLNIAQKIPFIGKLFGGGEAPEAPQLPAINPVEQVANIGQDTYAALVDPVSSAVDTLWTLVPGITDVYAAMASAVAAGVEMVSNQIEMPTADQNYQVEPISTVKMLTKSEGGGSRTGQLAATRQQERSVKLLETISGKLDKLNVGDSKELSEIAAFIKQYLPLLDNAQRVNPDLSNWML